MPRDPGAITLGTSKTARNSAKYNKYALHIFTSTPRRVTAVTTVTARGDGKDSYGKKKREKKRNDGLSTCAVVVT